MILDYVPSTAAFTVSVPRSSGADIQTLMMEHGLDLSIPASTPKTAVLFTREPYAAAAFGDVATQRASAQLAGMLREIDLSRAPSSAIHVKCPADRELWDFQKADIEYALRRRNTLIGDQPGLGKTPIAICFANEIAAERVQIGRASCRERV